MAAIPEFRQRGIAAAGGISAGPIHDLVFRLLDESGAGGAALDFGAGIGQLTGRLAADGRFTAVTGVDALARPAGLDAAIAWRQCDLNEAVDLPQAYDTLVCTEVIEHLENPRATFRTFARLLRPGGVLVLTTPNQESLRSYVALLCGGHFAAFRGDSYPAHLTALLRLDLERLCAEVGLARPSFRYSDHGGLPARPALRWQALTAGLARGRLFSDNLGLWARAPAGIA